MLKFIESIDGHEIYFDTNTNTFMDLTTNTPVKRVHAYPIAQYITGSDRTEIYYFSTTDKRDRYLAQHKNACKLTNLCNAWDIQIDIMEGV